MKFNLTTLKLNETLEYDQSNKPLFLLLQLWKFSFISCAQPSLTLQYQYSICAVVHSTVSSASTSYLRKM